MKDILNNGAIYILIDENKSLERKESMNKSQDIEAVIIEENRRFK